MYFLSENTTLYHKTTADYARVSFTSPRVSVETNLLKRSVGRWSSRIIICSDHFRRCLGLKTNEKYKY